MNSQSIIEQGRAISRAQAQDQRFSVPYRPQYARITGGIPSALLLQQISYWWEHCGRKPFYKFKEPCQDSTYRPNDSWCEELGFTRAVFDNALADIAVKITAGTSKADESRRHVVVYWTDSSRRTWYQLNEDLFNAYVWLAYNDPDLLGKAGKSLYLDDGGNLLYLDNAGNPLCLFSETIPETIPEREQTTAQKARGARPSEPDVPEIVEIEMVDEYDQEYACPACEHYFIVGALSKSAAVCPSCGQAFRVRGPDGHVICKPPQKLRRREVGRAENLGPWYPVAETFCAVAQLPYATMDQKTRAQFATQLKAVGDQCDADPALVARAVGRLKATGGWPKSLYQATVREAIALEIAALRAVEAQPEAVLVPVFDGPAEVDPPAEWVPAWWEPDDLGELVARRVYGAGLLNAGEFAVLLDGWRGVTVRTEQNGSHTLQGLGTNARQVLMQYGPVRECIARAVTDYMR